MLRQFLIENQVNRNRIAMTSVVLCVVGLIFMLFVKPIFGIEFTGGTVYTLDLDVGAVAKIVHSDPEFKISKDGEYTIVKVADRDNHLSDEEGSKFKKEELSLKNNSVSVQKIGASLGSELIHDSLVGLGVSFLFIAVYLAMRYNLVMATSALLALFHDILLTCVVLTLCKVEISSIVVGAILTVVGYSINDSVVTLDKLREMVRKHHDNPIQDAIVVTLTRNIRTCVATMLVILAMYLFGGEMVHDFAFTMLVGVFFGMISSITVMPLILQHTVRTLGSLETSEIPDTDGNI
ncbi:protein translocase subunit SecF [Photobacterium damselae]|uniref:protein translocase subunit SecF n=1 Tax=Photobacterium damselae TaxID=38293 RepID=UPI001EEDD514|nr:protein translocase subunit SecF [Photobacterium damselae]UKA04581.1 protein translocase subunit SecF [Photobacterium damselae subsp. damselae]